MKEMYKRSYPNWINSRYDFFLFVCRAHNTVNRRIDKPILQNASDCLKLFQSNVKINSPAKYRQSYLTYLNNNWSREHSGESLMKLAHVREMKKINEQYWNLREIDVNTIVFLADSDVTQPILQDPKRFSPSPSIPVLANNPNVRIGFRNGRLK